MILYGPTYGRTTKDTYANKDRVDSPLSAEQCCQHHGKWYRKCPHFAVKVAVSVPRGKGRRGGRRSPTRIYAKALKDKQ